MRKALRWAVRASTSPAPTVPGYAYGYWWWRGVRRGGGFGGVGPGRHDTVSSDPIELTITETTEADLDFVRIPRSRSAGSSSLGTVKESGDGHWR